VTSLAEYARCPRRHWLAVQMRLPEPRVDGRGGEDPERATVRGTLAHSLLAEVDLLATPLARRLNLAAAATRRGGDPGRAGTRRILDDVVRFLNSPAGQGLAGWARAGSLRREVPFLLRLPGSPPCYLDGAIDALAVEAGGVQIIDFKYARYHPGAEERYRVQLAAYALAASRAFGGRPVRASLHFLRGVPWTVDVTPSEEALQRLADEIPPLVLGAARGDGRDIPPDAVGRDEALRLGCAAIGYTIYPGSGARNRQYEDLRALTEEAKRKGLAVVVWSYPRGSGVSKDGETAVDIAAYAAQIAAQLGAHVIKVKPPKDLVEGAEAKKVFEKYAIPTKTLADRVRHVVQSAFNGKRIVIFSGGEAKGTDEVLAEVRGLKEGGAFGSIMGRNAFQRPRAEALKLLDEVMKIYAP